jgi:hypothetical protein
LVVGPFGFLLPNPLKMLDGNGFFELNLGVQLFVKVGFSKDFVFYRHSFCDFVQIINVCAVVSKDKTFYETETKRLVLRSFLPVVFCGSFSADICFGEEGSFGGAFFLFQRVFFMICRFWFFNLKGQVLGLFRMELGLFHFRETED